MSLAGVQAPNIPPTWTPASIYAIEVGTRAALRSETMRRDKRWWDGLWK